MHAATLSIDACTTASTGSAVTWTYVVTNAGDVALTDVAVSDLGECVALLPVGVLAQVAVLDAGS